MMAHTPPRLTLMIDPKSGAEQVPVVVTHMGLPIIRIELDDSSYHDFHGSEYEAGAVYRAGSGKCRTRSLREGRTDKVFP